MAIGFCCSRPASTISLSTPLINPVTPLLLFAQSTIRSDHFHALVGMSQDDTSPLRYVRYDSSRENEYVAAMRQLISKDLSEPYSIYVYRYFLYQWGDLCFLTMDEKDEIVGCVVSKLEPHRGGPLRGYIAMLAVREEYRGRRIATKLVRMAIDAMIERDADEV